MSRTAYTELSFLYPFPTTPTQLSTAHALEVLSLANNALTGSIPQSFSRLTKLKLFSASNNKVNGELLTGPCYGAGVNTCLKSLHKSSVVRFTCERKQWIPP